MIDQRLLAVALVLKRTGSPFVRENRALESRALCIRNELARAGQRRATGARVVRPRLLAPSETPRVRGKERNMGIFRTRESALTAPETRKGPFLRELGERVGHCPSADDPLTERDESDCSNATAPCRSLV